MAQNIYDQEAFFNQYSQLPRQVQGLNGAPEWPALRAMLPENLTGSRVLDLGCGFGWVCRWSRSQGAIQATGIELSENMLARARAFPKDDGITYQQADLNTVTLPALTYDIAFSSLALHYLPNLAQLMSRVFESLVPGGVFVFSVEHPIYTAPRNPRWIKDHDEQDQYVWPLDQYLLEGSRITSWFVEGVVKQHRTMATYISMLLREGFVLADIEEWGPSPEQLAEDKLGIPLGKDQPPFLLLKAVKPLV